MAQPHDLFSHRLARLREELQDLAARQQSTQRPVELDQSRIGRLSRADAMQAQAMSQAVARRREEAIRRIDAALDRLRDGEFGFCVRCGEPIDMARLERDPATPYCVACARDA